jgi:hypothetical protein
MNNPLEGESPKLAADSDVQNSAKRLMLKHQKSLEKLTNPDNWDVGLPRRRLTRNERLQAMADHGIDTWADAKGEK